MGTVYEDRPEKDTPPRVLALLMNYGGRTPDGRPLWRLVLAMNRRVRIAGVMTTMPQGVVPEDTAPLRTEEGVFWIPRYGNAGWVLERWFPPEVWGSQMEWEAERSGPDNRTRMRAAWPRHGEYFLMGGPWKMLPSADTLKAVIRAQIREEQTRPVDWGNHVRAELLQEMLEQERMAEEYEDQIAGIGRQAALPIMGSVSLAAQGVRNRLAEQIGGEDWYLGVA